MRLSNICESLVPIFGSLYLECLVCMNTHAALVAVCSCFEISMFTQYISWGDSVLFYDTVMRPHFLWMYMLHLWMYSIYCIYAVYATYKL